MKNSINIYGLKCDTEGCGYRDDTIKFEDYPQHIMTTRCPRCNNVLLTQFEYDRSLKTINIANKFFYIIHQLRWLNPLHYFRLIFGDHREIKSYKYEFPYRKNNNQ